MFPLVSGRHVGAYPDEHQHGVSIQICVRRFLRISSIRKIAVTWIRARCLCIFTFFLFSDIGFIYWTALIFILIYYDLRVTLKTQQFSSFETCNVTQHAKIGKNLLFAWYSTMFSFFHLRLHFPSHFYNILQRKDILRDRSLFTGGGGGGRKEGLLKWETVWPRSCDPPP